MSDPAAFAPFTVLVAPVLVALVFAWALNALLDGLMGRR